jgi:Mg2+ and Co2+ transporter CorA
MNWELDALKILAKNPTVPGIALRDTIGEIERLTKQVVELQDSNKNGKNTGLQLMTRIAELEGQVTTFEESFDTQSEVYNKLLSDYMTLKNRLQSIYDHNDRIED